MKILTGQLIGLDRARALDKLRESKLNGFRVVTAFVDEVDASPSRDRAQVHVVLNGKPTLDQVRGQYQVTGCCTLVLKYISELAKTKYDMLSDIKPCGSKHMA